MNIIEFIFPSHYIKDLGFSGGINLLSKFSLSFFYKKNLRILCKHNYKNKNDARKKKIKHNFCSYLYDFDRLRKKFNPSES